MGPDGVMSFEAYWRAERLPFIGLPDPDHRVALQYRQEVNLFKLGRMPLVMVMDPQGMIRYAHYGASMSDIPDPKILLDAIDQINGTSK